MGLFNNGLFHHKQGWSEGYVSPYMLEILSTRPGAPRWTSASGTLVANTGQVVTCTRASSGYCLGDDGLMHLLGNDTVRVEPTGLLTEFAATNRIVRSNEFTNAAWTVFGSLTITANTADVTDPTGANTASKFVYGTGTNPEFVYQGQGQTVVTMSVWLRTASGTATVYLGDNGNYAQACAVTSAWQRFQVYGSGSGNFCIGFMAVGGSGSPCTVYAWGAQVETTPFATSYIPTTAAIATRAADDVTVANPLNPSNPTAWRYGFTAIPASTWANVQALGGGFVMPMALGAHATNDSARFYSNGNNCVWQIYDTVAPGSLFLNGLTTGSATLTVDLLDTAGTMSSPQTGGTSSGQITVQPATIWLGQSGVSAFYLAGHIRDIYVNNT